VTTGEMQDQEPQFDIDPIERLRRDLRRFAADRDWEQFHTPKNLAIALSVEVGELLEHFQWLTADESERLSANALVQVRQELADVFLYLIRLADRLNVDLSAAARDKLTINAQKYPPDRARGTAKKYTEL
jgi:dCTP diphosphatase